MAEAWTQIAVMPDSFGGTLTAVEAAAAIAAGWRRSRPHDQMVLAPQSDGGPGLVDVLSTAFVVDPRTVEVAGPLGAPVRAQWLLHDRTAYLESAQACGLHLLPARPGPETALAASTTGVGQLLAAALQAEARRIVMGLGGSATTDGGRGACEALGGLAAARWLLAGVDLIAATDVDNPLLGADGAAAVFAPQKGADPETVAVLEARLTGWADEVAAAGADVRDRPGAGAAGGLGAALLACGAQRVSGAAVVAELTGRAGVIAASDLVITGEGRLDEQTLRGKLVAQVADEARAAGVPLVILAGQSSLTGTRRDRLGAVYTLAEESGSPAAAKAQAAPLLTDLAARLVARWQPGRCRPTEPTVRE